MKCFPWIKFSLYVHQHKVIKVNSDTRAWPSSTGQFPPEISKLALQILFTVRLGWIDHKRLETPIPLGFQGQCLQTFGKGDPFLQLLFSCSPLSQQPFAPRGAGEEQHSAVILALGINVHSPSLEELSWMALQSNSSFPRERNLLPPRIKAPLVAVVLPAQLCQSSTFLLLIAYSNVTTDPSLHYISTAMDASVQWTGAGNKSSLKIAWQRNT